jgi:tetratricopeptide (TPR) repeat protein
MTDPVAAELQRAGALVGAHRYEAAVPLLHQVIASNPALARPQCLLAQCLLALGEPRGALAAASSAAALAPEEGWAQRLRSIALLRLKKRRQALAAAREAVRLAPREPNGYTALVDAELASRHYGRAQAAAQQARELAPRLAAGHNALGIVALRRRRPRAAEQHFRDALAIDPQNALVRNNLGVAVLRQGRRREAVQHFADSSRIDPRQPAARRNATKAARAGGVAVAIFVGAEMLNTASRSGPAAVRLATLALGVLVLTPIIVRRRHAVAEWLRLRPRTAQDPKASRQLLRRLRRESSSGLRPMWLLTTVGACVFGAVALVAGVSFVGQLVTAPATGTTVALLATTAVSAGVATFLVCQARRQPA